MDMEVEFLNLGLDIIGLGVFNYEFGSITRESPVIKVAMLASLCLIACQLILTSQLDACSASCRAAG